MTAMDHAYAEAHGLVDDYLADRLSESERDAFEAHYFDCAACLAELEAASEFRTGLRQAAVEDAVRVQAAELAHAVDLARANHPSHAAHASHAANRATARGLFAILALLSTRQRLALMGLVLAVLALPLALLLARDRALGSQLAAARAGATAGERRLATELARERQARTAAEASAATAAGPRVNVPVFLLAAVRGGAGSDAPVVRLPLAGGSGPVVLTVELAAADHPSYRAVLYSAGDRVLWQGDSLHPDARDSLTVALPETMLPLGRYRLSITAAGGDGRSIPVGEYPFEVVRPR